jgi:prevent-host-death family protein
MSSVTLEDTKARLSELIEKLHPGEEIVITRDQKPVARLVGESMPSQATCGIMDKLQAARIEAPPDFAGNLALYVRDSAQ